MKISGGRTGMRAVFMVRNESRRPDSLASEQVRFHVGIYLARKSAGDFTFAGDTFPAGGDLVHDAALRGQGWQRKREIANVFGPNFPHPDRRSGVGQEMTATDRRLHHFPDIIRQYRVVESDPNYDVRVKNGRIVISDYRTLGDVVVTTDTPTHQQVAGSND